MTIDPLPETLLVTKAIRVRGDDLANPSLKTRKSAREEATAHMTRTAGSFGRVLVDDTVCLDRETEDFVMDEVTLHFSALTVLR